MRVFRYEHPNTGFGPYRNPFADNDWFADDYVPDPLYDEYDEFRYDSHGLGWHEDNSLTTHPAPQITLGRRPHEWEVCGCDSLDSLIRWFDGFHERLEEFGFVIREYETDGFLGPDRCGQVLFHKSRATLIS